MKASTAIFNKLVDLCVGQATAPLLLSWGPRSRWWMFHCQHCSRIAWL